jgi:hypothetical protein
MEHLMSNKLIHLSQHGFMSGKSCVSDGMAIFYLDFAKAFDKVPMRRLIAKLNVKGLDPEMARWIEE